MLSCPENMKSFENINKLLYLVTRMLRCFFSVFIALKIRHNNTIGYVEGPSVISVYSFTFPCDSSGYMAFFISLGFKNSKQNKYTLISFSCQILHEKLVLGPAICKFRITS